MDIAASTSTPGVGDAVQVTVTLTNDGPAEATGITARVSGSGGLDFVGSSSDAGAFSSSDGRWLLDALGAGDTATLVVNLVVAAGTGGTSIDIDAAIEAVDQIDTTSANDEASVTLTVGAALVVTVVEKPASAVLPGATRNDLMFVRIANETATTEILTSLTFSNVVTGPGTQAELDASWSSLSLLLHDRGEYTPLDPVDAGAGRSGPAVFSGGVVTFGELAEKVNPGQTIEIVIAGVVSTVARDGDGLNVRLDTDDVKFDSGIIPTGEFPFDRGESITVNGMSAAQIVVHPENLSPTLSSASTNRLALDVKLPANGYRADVLTGLAVTNVRFATANAISRMRAWRDDGNGVFDPLADTPLGDFAWTGDRWALTGLSMSVPVGGRRVFVSVDLDEDADGQVRLALVDVAMTSANDGPLDRAVESGVTQIHQHRRSGAVRLDPHRRRPRHPGPARGGAPAHHGRELVRLGPGTHRDADHGSQRRRGGRHRGRARCDPHPASPSPGRERQRCSRRGGHRPRHR